MAKPKADLGALAVPKATAAAAVPHAAVAHPPAVATTVPSAAPAATPPKALTVKLDADTYWRLQAYCMDRGQQEGRRVTHQEVLVEGLARLLDDAAR